MSTHPEVLWAQRSSDTTAEKNVVYLSVNLPDIQENTLKCDLTSKNLSFAATAGNESKNIPENNYAFSINFYKEIDPEKSTKKLSSRSFYLVLRKKDKALEYWPRLTSEKIKTPYIKTDFSKWVDEDEQGGGSNTLDDDMGGMDMSGMGGMGGMSGGMDFEKMMADIKAKGSDEAGADEDEEDPVQV